MVTAESGAVFAEVSYRRVGDFEYEGVRIRIVRNGEAVVDDAVPRTSTSDAPSSGDGRDDSPLRVIDLDADGEPEVVVDLYTSGAHCCWYSLAYRFARDSYRWKRHWWYHTGYRLRDADGDGRVEFVSADNRFAYRFASFAGSGFPLRVWRYESGRFLDVTREFGPLVARDAARWWRLSARERKRHGEVKGVLAAYLADMHLLDRERQGWRQVRRAYRASDRNAFFRKLERFLTRTGYTD